MAEHDARRPRPRTAPRWLGASPCTAPTGLHVLMLQCMHGCACTQAHGDAGVPGGAGRARLLGTCCARACPYAHACMQHGPSASAHGAMRAHMRASVRAPCGTACSTAGRARARMAGTRTAPSLLPCHPAPCCMDTDLAALLHASLACVHGVRPATAAPPRALMHPRRTAPHPQVRGVLSCPLGIVTASRDKTVKIWVEEGAAAYKCASTLVRAWRACVRVVHVHVCTCARQAPRASLACVRALCVPCSALTPLRCAPRAGGPHGLCRAPGLHCARHERRLPAGGAGVRCVRAPRVPCSRRSACVRGLHLAHPEPAAHRAPACTNRLARHDADRVGRGHGRAPGAPQWPRLPGVGRGGAAHGGDCVGVAGQVGGGGGAVARSGACPGTGLHVCVRVRMRLSACASAPGARGPPFTARGPSSAAPRSAGARSHAAASSSARRTLRLWRGGGCVATLEGHEAAVLSLLVLPSGDILSGSGVRGLRAAYGAVRAAGHRRMR